MTCWVVLHYLLVVNMSNYCFTNKVGQTCIIMIMVICLIMVVVAFNLVQLTILHSLDIAVAANTLVILAAVCSHSIMLSSHDDPIFTR